MGLYVGHFDFTAQLLWTVPALFSPEECASILDGAQGGAWLPATVNAEEGRVVDPRIRSSTTAVLRDPALADELFRRVKPHVPERMTTELGARGRVAMHLAGIFLPLRIYRYEVGQHFGLHQDQSYAGEGGTRSLLTLMVYLNEGFAGGATEFPEQERIIVPKTGDALLFQHMLLHAGNPVTDGTKFVLRSDVLYRPVP
ncbi:prolyl hydroxylase family protein [Polyangium sorediatum]|uniref:2OG-Fe(II) oxygenase n=1 Tax=Polyangium sorediatum TaxID=889274 RepID=A0ABT6NT23_9BACT|nr:2OG-Fe(II) oxygenase [Polyangium sorediatum]MDI1431483.1 2OG-Fe(II) oxygenase [Polyangium sorediatum]